WPARPFRPAIAGLAASAVSLPPQPLFWQPVFWSASDRSRFSCSGVRPPAAGPVVRCPTAVSSCAFAWLNALIKASVLAAGLSDITLLLDLVQRVDPANKRPDRSDR